MREIEKREGMKEFKRQIHETINKLLTKKQNESGVRFIMPKYKLSF